jgi:hypothetical protein
MVLQMPENVGLDPDHQIMLESVLKITSPLKTGCRAVTIAEAHIRSPRRID